MKSTLSLIITFVSCMTMSSAQTDQNTLFAEIHRLEHEYGGRLGFMAKNLGTGEVVRYNADERFPTASVIKLPVMAAFYHLADEKAVDPEEEVELTEKDRKPGAILEYLSAGTTMTLRDAVTLMITLSDNTASNLVLDRLAAAHSERMALVNEFLVSKGLRNTRILNRLYTVETKQQTGEAYRYGIGVSTPEDMILFLQSLYDTTLVSPASCAEMMKTLERQTFHDMMPRLLPSEECTAFRIFNKAGSINESKVDVGLVLSDKANLAVAIFVDKHPAHGEETENIAMLFVAHVARAIWNHYTGMTGYGRAVKAADVDWNLVPGGRWAIYRSPAAPFPHPDRMNGYARKDTTYPAFPHYLDSSVVVFVPNGFHETAQGSNAIVHYHGHNNDNLGVLERYTMPQQMVQHRTNALLVIPQGPYRARDSFGGKVEDPGGFERLVSDVMLTMQREGVVKSAKVNHVIVSAHSGGYHPAAFTLHQGGMIDRVSDVFLFDAFYGEQEYFRDWLLGGTGRLFGCYTEHLKQEHQDFERELAPTVGDRLRFTATTVEHDEVIQHFFGPWLEQLGPEWCMPATQHE